MFQSTPDLINRENSFYKVATAHRTVFQSTPDLINRENANAGEHVNCPQCGFNPLPI